MLSAIDVDVSASAKGDMGDSPMQWMIGDEVLARLNADAQASFERWMLGGGGRLTSNCIHMNVFSSSSSGQIIHMCRKRLGRARMAICNRREGPSCCPGHLLELSCQLGASPLTIDGATARLGHSCDCVAGEPSCQGQRLAAYVQEDEARPQRTRSAGENALFAQTLSSTSISTSTWVGPV